MVVKAGHHELSPKRIRVLYNKTYVADTTSAQLVWEHPNYPYYYIPVKDIKEGCLGESHSTELEVGRGVMQLAGRLMDIKLSNTTAARSLTVGSATTDKVVQLLDGKLKDHVRFEFSAMDAWFEEDEQIYVHPRDPYKRVDVLPSTRHIEVKIDGVTIAESSRPQLLFETGLPTRYYIPKTALNWEFVKESETMTKCPYKGTASYYSVVVNGVEYKDVIWYYNFTTLECQAVAGTVCFYNEKVDIWVDGVELPRPKTKWS